MTAEVRLKHIARIAVSNVDKKSVDGDLPVRLCNYTDVYYSDRIGQSIDFMTATASHEQLRNFRLAPGDVLITKDSETPEDIAVPSLVEVSADDLVCGYHLALIRPDQRLVDPRFLFWALASTSVREWFSTQATGVTRFGLRSSSIADVRIRLPVLPEQRELADFLDVETARIDALIEKKRRQRDALIEKLRTAVSAATRADAVIDKDARERAERVGWRSLRLRRCFSAIDYGIGQATTASGAYAVLGMGHIAEGRIVDAPTGYVDDVEASLLLTPGDLLFNRTNSLAMVGKVALFAGEVHQTTFASYLVRLRTNELAEAAYLNYLLNTPEVLGLARSIALPSIGQANLNPGRYTAISIVVPPVDEQRRIVVALDRDSTTVDHICDRLGRQTTLLREHRQALVTAAVTGELNIATAAA